MRLSKHYTSTPACVSSSVHSPRHSQLPHKITRAGCSGRSPAAARLQPTASTTSAVQQPDKQILTGRRHRLSSRGGLHTSSGRSQTRRTPGSSCRSPPRPGQRPCQQSSSATHQICRQISQRGRAPSQRSQSHTTGDTPARHQSRPHAEASQPYPCKQAARTGHTQQSAAQCE